MAATSVASATCVTSARVASAACMAPSITHLISVEMIKGLFSASRMWTGITVMRIEAIINVAAELVGTVEPRAGSDEYAAVEPLGTVVAIWGAGVRSVVVEAIRANRLCSDIDGDLGGCRAWDAQQRGNKGGKGKNFQIAHKLSLTLEKGNPNAKVVVDRKGLKLKEGFGKREHRPEIDRI